MNAQTTLSSAYSIRESLQGALTDFVRRAGFACIHLEELIREFVGLLAAYREEGVPLFPEVFVFASEEGLTALAPGGLQLNIGSLPLRGEEAEKVLKHCAPLAVHGWAIFVLKEDGNLRYGVFRSMRHSLAISAEESIRDLGTDVPAVLIRNRGHLVVELIGPTVQRFTAALTTTPAQSSVVEGAVSKFVESVVSSVETPERLKPYLQRLFLNCLQRCHGTLLATVLGDAQDYREAGVWPDKQINISTLHSAALATASADALADLQAAEAILTGMINSDGVVLFNDAATVLAYRVFLRANEAEKTQIEDHGGSRRRAFELMCLRLGVQFRAVLFRSQDGETKCERAS